MGSFFRTRPTRSLSPPACRLTVVETHWCGDFFCGGRVGGPAPGLASQRRHVGHIQVSSMRVAAVCLPAVCLKVRASSRLQPLNIKLERRRRVTDTVDSSALFISGGAGGPLLSKGGWIFLPADPPNFFFFFCLGGRTDTSGQVAHRQQKKVTRRCRAAGACGR